MPKELIFLLAAVIVDPTDYCPLQSMISLCASPVELQKETHYGKENESWHSFKNDKRCHCVI